ncbi:DgyrCDS8179 [Dimorphilus gyrociliatus]|uniref:DgyrCDS8179 n=1 Tax=Dimorphilus gyrociliatus TaxID=2664684 RepID=A0A7I8VVT0_9ANNE|nr:DgyrCDS8179 [Dimorphilus gyrociliatus]
MVKKVEVERLEDKCLNYLGKNTYILHAYKMMTPNFYLRWNLADSIFETIDMIENGINEKHLKLFKSKRSCLTRVEMNARFISKKSLRNLLKNHHLELVNISGVDEFPISEWLQYIETEYLRFLSIRNCRLFNNRKRELSCIKNFTNLRTLRLVSIPFHNQDLKDIINYIQLIKCLELTGTSVTDIQPVCQLPKLKIFIQTYYPASFNLEQIITLKPLKSLTIANDPTVEVNSYSIFDILLQRIFWPELEYLDISGKWKCNAFIMEPFLKRHTKLLCLGLVGVQFTRPFEYPSKIEIFGTANLLFLLNGLSACERDERRIFYLLDFFRKSYTFVLEGNYPILFINFFKSFKNLIYNCWDFRWHKDSLNRLITLCIKYSKKILIDKFQSIPNHEISSLVSACIKTLERLNCCYTTFEFVKLLYNSEFRILKNAQINNFATLKILFNFLQNVYDNTFSSWKNSYLREAHRKCNDVITYIFKHISEQEINDILEKNQIPVLKKFDKENPNFFLSNIKLITAWKLGHKRVIHVIGLHNQCLEAYKDAIKFFYQETNSSGPADRKICYLLILINKYFDDENWLKFFNEEFSSFVSIKLKNSEKEATASLSIEIIWNVLFRGILKKDIKKKKSRSHWPQIIINMLIGFEKWRNKQLKAPTVGESIWCSMKSYCLHDDDGRLFTNIEWIIDNCIQTLQEEFGKDVLDELREAKFSYGLEW